MTIRFQAEARADCKPSRIGCNSIALMAANSLLMTGLEELQELLELPLPDWDEIRKNQPGGMDLADAIQ